MGLCAWSTKTCHTFLCKTLFSFYREGRRKIWKCSFFRETCKTIKNSCRKKSHHLAFLIQRYVLIYFLGVKSSKIGSQEKEWCQQEFLFLMQRFNDLGLALPALPPSLMEDLAWLLVLQLLLFFLRLFLVRIMIH